MLTTNDDVRVVTVNGNEEISLRKQTEIHLLLLANNKLLTLKDSFIRMIRNEPTLTKLDLSAKAAGGMLDDQNTLPGMMLILESNTNITHLDLSRNSVSNWNAISQYIRATVVLKKFTMSDTPVTNPDDARNIFSAIKFSTSLLTVVLQACRFSDSDFIEYVIPILSTNDVLKTLDLTENNFTDSSLRCLQEDLNNNNRSINNIFIIPSNNSIKREDAEKLEQTSNVNIIINNISTE